MKVTDEMVTRYKIGARALTEFSPGDEVIRAGIEAALEGVPMVAMTPERTASLHVAADYLAGRLFSLPVERAESHTAVLDVMLAEVQS